MGRGGIAVVHQATRADNPKLGPLAIKVAHRTNEQRDERFIRELILPRANSSESLFLPKAYSSGTISQIEST